MQKISPVVQGYLNSLGPHKLEIGAKKNAKRGWLASDLQEGIDAAGIPIIALDATKTFPLPSSSFDYIYTEHMIEHISFDQARIMLCECNRVLKDGGVIRIVTPSLGFMCRVISSDRGALEERYIQWSVKTFVPTAPKVTNAFFMNNFMRNWGHKFIYDRETLWIAMELAGFGRISACDINVSEHPDLCGLVNVSRLPSGFLELESMVVEGSKLRDTPLADAAGNQRV